MLSTCRACTERHPTGYFSRHTHVLPQTNAPELQILSYLCPVLCTEECLSCFLHHKDNKLLLICRDIKSQDDFISFSDEIVMILVRFIKLLTIFILTGCSCLRSGQGCNIKEIVSETYNNDSIWTIHVVFNGRPDRFQRKQLVNERITKEHPNEVYRISAMKEYNGKMYNNYIYQIIVESK